MRDERLGARAGTRRQSRRRESGRPAADAGPGLASAGLVGTIEGEIIPRLMLVHRVHLDSPVGSAAGILQPGPDDIDTLAGLVLARDAAPALDYAESLLGRGASLEAIYLELIAPAARRLGTLWDDDQVDFLQVTLGLCRLQQVVHRLGPACEVGHPAALPSRALLASLAGDHHTLGVRMVADLFRRRGWEAHDLPGAPGDEILVAVRAQAFDVFGLSVACDARIGQAASIIAAVRRESRNPHIRVMVGGQAFAGQPGRVAEVGADATARDGLQAAAQARELLAAGATQTC